MNPGPNMAHILLNADPHIQTQFNSQRVTNPGQRGVGEGRKVKTLAGADMFP